MQVLSHSSYDGKVADIWSCGVMLYIMMTGAAALQSWTYHVVGPGQATIFCGLLSATS